MTKDDVQKIRLEIEADGQSALSLMLNKDGTIGRQGNGNLPPQKISVMGKTDGSEFRQLMQMIDEKIFAHQGIYDHPNKQGMPIKYSIAFLGNEPNVTVFEFRLGLDNRDVGDLLPYFDALIKKAVSITDNWYEKALAENEVKQREPTIQEPAKKPWWRIW